MKNLNLMLLAFPLTTICTYASDIDVHSIMGKALFIFVLFIIINVLYIMSQNKLIDSLKTNDEKLRTHKLWTWTQLIPIWSFVAQIVTIVKITDQYKAYIREENIKTDKISEYKPIWGWLFIGFSILTIIAPFLIIFTLIFWIIYWMNISSTAKSITNMHLK